MGDIFRNSGNNTVLNIPLFSEVPMRYANARKYPITQMKKNSSDNRNDRIVDISLGTAIGVMAFVFLEGMFWGYMIRRLRH